MIDHKVTNNINNKYQCNDVIEYTTIFDNKFSLSSRTNKPRPVFTASLQGGKKHWSKMVSGLTYLWDSRATKRVIKSWHNKPYDQNMRSNKVEYSTAAGLYCTAHDAKVPFCMPEFSSSMIILHHFHVDNNEGEGVILYGIIIGHNLMEK